MNLTNTGVLLLIILGFALSLPHDLVGAQNENYFSDRMIGGPTLIVNVDPYIFIGHEFSISIDLDDRNVNSDKNYTLRTEYVFSSIRVQEDSECTATFELYGDKGIKINPTFTIDLFQSLFVKCSLYAVVTGGNTKTVGLNALYYDSIAQSKRFYFPAVNSGTVGVSGKNLVKDFVDPINFSLNRTLEAGATAQFTFATAVFTATADVECVNVDTETAVASVAVDDNVVTLTMLADVSSINCNIQMTPTGDDSSYVEILTSASTTTYIRYADVAVRTTLTAALLPADNVDVNALTTFTLHVENLKYVQENNGVYTSNMVTFGDVSSPCIDKTNGTTEVASITASGSVLTFAWLVDPAKTISCTFSAIPVPITEGVAGTDSPTFSMDSVTTDYTVAKTNYVIFKASYSINVNLVSTNYLGQSISVVHDGVQYKSFSVGDVITISSLTCTNITAYASGDASVDMKEDSIVITYVKDSRNIVKAMLSGVTFTSNKASITFNGDSVDDVTIPRITDLQVSASLNTTRVGHNTLFSIDVEANNFESGKAIQFSIDRTPFFEQEIDYYRVKSLSCDNNVDISLIEVTRLISSQPIDTKFYRGFNVTVSNSASFKCDIVLFFFIPSSSEAQISDFTYDGYGFSGMSLKIPVIKPTIPVVELRRLDEPTDTKNTFALELTIDNVFYARDYTFEFQLPHIHTQLYFENMACSSDFGKFLDNGSDRFSLLFKPLLGVFLAIGDHSPLVCTVNVTVKYPLLGKNWTFIQKRAYIDADKNFDVHTFRLPNYPFVIPSNQYPSLEVVAHGSTLNVTYLHNTLAPMQIKFDYPDLFKLDGVTPCMYNGEVYGHIINFQVSALKIPYHGCWFLVRPISTAVSNTQKTPVVSVVEGGYNYLATAEYPVIPSSEPGIRYNFRPAYNSAMIFSINGYNLSASDVIKIEFSEQITVEFTQSRYEYTMIATTTSVFITPKKLFDGSVLQIFDFFVKAKTSVRQMNVTASIVGTSIKTEFSILLSYGLDVFSSFEPSESDPSKTILYGYLFSAEYDFKGRVYSDLNGGELRNPISCGTSLTTNDIPFTYVDNTIVFKASTSATTFEYYCYFNRPTKLQYSLTNSLTYLMDTLSDQPLMISTLFNWRTTYKTVPLPTVSIQFSGQKLLSNVQIANVTQAIYDLLKTEISSLILDNIIVVSNSQSSLLLPENGVYSLDFYNSTTVSFALKNTVYNTIPSFDSKLKSVLSTIYFPVYQATFALQNVESYCLTTCGYGCALCSTNKSCLVNEDCESSYCNLNGACALKGDDTFPVNISSANYVTLSIILSLVLSALCFTM